MDLTKKDKARNYFLDYFYLPPDYAERISRYADPHLKKSEAVKTRICYSAMCSILSSTAFAVPTHGGSAVVCVWAARRWQVATKKLKFIRAELTKRNIELRPFLHRDWIIPASVAVTFIAIGMGVDFGLASFVPIGSPGADGAISTSGHETATQHLGQHTLGTNGTADSQLTSHATNLFSTGGPVNDVAVDPSTTTLTAHGALQNWSAGFRDQFVSLFGGSPHAISGLIPDQTYESALAWVTGAQSAGLLEHELAALTGQQVLQRTCERLDAESLLPRRSSQWSCRRLPWAVDNICMGCDQPIVSGKFYHACHCVESDEDFSLCLACSGKANGKDGLVWVLVQTAVPGSLFLPVSTSVQLREVAGPKKLGCNACGRVISRGWYYDCLECRIGKKRWTECVDCYQNGRPCPGGDDHTFYAFPRAVFATHTEDNPYQRLMAKEGAKTGQVTCSICAVLVTKGAFYRKY